MSKDKISHKSAQTIGSHMMISWKVSELSIFVEKTAKVCDKLLVNLNGINTGI